MMDDFQRARAELAMHPRRLDFSLRALLAEVIAACSTFSRQKQLSLSFRIADGLPATLRGDPDRLRQTLCDLLGDTIELTDSGSVRLEVELEQATEWGLVVRFEVIDSSCGCAQLVQTFSPATGKSAFNGVPRGTTVQR